MKVKRINKLAKLPKRANKTDAGLDLYSIEHLIIKPQSRACVDTGIALELPHNTVGLIWPRSGMAVRGGIDVLAGVIDESYRGSVGVVLYNSDKHNDYVINCGDKIAQLIVQEVYFVEPEWADELDKTDRNDSGFGSTGKC